MATATSDINLTLVDPSDQRKLVTPKITVDQLARMIEMGVVEERPSWELLDGVIVRVDKSGQGQDIMTIHPAHVMAIERLLNLRPRFQAHGCHLRAQAPIELPPFNAPEPDGCIVLGEPEQYAKRHPRPEDILCVIEAADSSLLTDRRRKLRLYAQFGLPMYVILNLQARQAEVYNEPVGAESRYDARAMLSMAEPLSFPTRGAELVTVRVRELIPEA